jgi:hypothetical protein
MVNPFELSTSFYRFGLFIRNGHHYHLQLS